MLNYMTFRNIKMFNILNRFASGMVGQVVNACIEYSVTTLYLIQVSELLIETKNDRVCVVK